MADRGKYIAVVRNDRPVPDVVHNTVRPDTTETRKELHAKAEQLSENTKGRIPFTVARIVHEPFDPRIVGECPARKRLIDRSRWGARIGSTDIGCSRPADHRGDHENHFVGVHWRQKRNHHG